MNIESKVKSLIEETINSNGFILDEVLYVKEDGNNFLRIVIDKNGIVDIEDCVLVTHLIDPIIDTLEIEDSYILDVCSKQKGCE